MHPSMSDDIGKALQVSHLNVDHYVHDEIFGNVDQIAELNNTLCDINEAHCRVLAKSYHNYSYEYAVAGWRCTICLP